MKLIVWLPWLIVNDCWTWDAAFQLVLPAWLALMVQVPTVTKVTVVPETVQMLVVADVKTTVRPEEAVALIASGLRSKVLVEIAANVIVWLPLLIVKLRATCEAAFQLVFPAWLALIVQVPTVTKVTVVPETVQTLVVAEVKATGRPEEAVALSVIGPSSKRLPARAPKVIVWSALAIVSVCCACVSEPLEAVTTGEPAFVSLYLKLALDEPSAICTDVIVVVSPVSRNTPAPALVARLTVIDPVVVGLLAESWR